MDDAYLSLPEAARLLGVTQRMLRYDLERYGDRLYPRSFKRRVSTRWRIHRDDVAERLEAMGRNMPEGSE